jgi:hypothetical protein
MEGKFVIETLNAAGKIRPVKRILGTARAREKLGRRPFYTENAACSCTEPEKIRPRARPTADADSILMPVKWAHFCIQSGETARGPIQDH